MPRSSRTSTPLRLDPKIEKTIIKLRKKVIQQKYSTGFYAPSSSLTLEKIDPQGNPLWNKPEFMFTSFPKAPSSSPFQSPHKTYPLSSVKFETIDPSESDFDN